MHMAHARAFRSAGSALSPSYRTTVTPVKDPEAGNRIVLIRREQRRAGQRHHVKEAVPGRAGHPWSFARQHLAPCRNSRTLPLKGARAPVSRPQRPPPPEPLLSSA
jgi:hypothetical protein